jgi:propanol-preferring alcohol dehydrogenase
MAAHVDGTCQFCRRARENPCHEARYTGYDVDGGYAEYAIVPEDFAYEFPEYLDDEHISPLLCAGLIGYRAPASHGAGAGPVEVGQVRQMDAHRHPDRGAPRA